jgi:hypothetical protein
MGLTPDRHPGVSDEEGVILDTTVNASVDGEFRYNGVRFSFKDATGEFDPRTGGSGITEAQHKVLRQLIHFIDDGPAEGFTSGAYKETTGTIFPTSEVWYESSSKLNKIVSLDTTWTGAVPTTEVWKVYDTDGSTVLATVTDTVSHSGIFETSRIRTIT